MVLLQNTFKLSNCCHWTTPRLAMTKQLIHVLLALLFSLQFSVFVVFSVLGSNHLHTCSATWPLFSWYDQDWSLKNSCEGQYHSWYLWLETCNCVILQFGKISWTFKSLEHFPLDIAALFVVVVCHQLTFSLALLVYLFLKLIVLCRYDNSVHVYFN